jgi:thioredoxin reductase (NADPH)
VAIHYDVLIIGGGLAGMTAGIYAARFGLRTGLIERTVVGEQLINLERIENFPGFPNGIAGSDLVVAVQEQGVNAGVIFFTDEVNGVVRDGNFVAVSCGGSSYRAKAVIVAAGSSMRQLSIPGEKEFYGRGVSHSAICDGPLHAGKVVGVVGGGDSAADEALTLAQNASKVLLFHRRDQLRAQQVIQERLTKNPKIEIVWNSVVTEVLGEETVASVRTINVITRLENLVDLSGLFVYVGLEPNSDIVRGLVKLDNTGHIPVNIRMETNLPGLYAVGDIRQNSASQLASSAGDGATAAVGAYEYIRGNRW